MPVEVVINKAAIISIIGRIEAAVLLRIGIVNNYTIIAGNGWQSFLSFDSQPIRLILLYMSFMSYSSLSLIHI